VRPAFALLALLAAAPRAQTLIGDFPKVQVPPENPLTPEKALLGQALFFEEQLSSDDTMACATCHLPDAGGGDPRAGLRAAGFDGELGTPDDEFGSPGMRLQDARGDYQEHALFGFERQATARNSPSVIGAAFFNTQFWDARALPTFHSLSGEVLIREYASLETQAVEPLLSGVEMSHPGRDWNGLTAKLALVRPLDLAGDLPPALAQFLGTSTSYAPLFAAAFGSEEITRERIAMAIASYERTLVADRTPFDLGTLTARQELGLTVFQDAERGLCETCHPSANRFFTDGAVRTIFLPEHPRSVKTPSLRNVGLRRRFMSNGVFSSLDEVVAHYEEIGFLDPLAPEEREALIDFVANGLNDPRVASRQPPFDRPTLHSERAPPGSNLFGKATAGSGGLEPEILADAPAHLGNVAFQIGLGRALGGARAVLFLSLARAAAGAELRGAALSVDLSRALRLPFVTAGEQPGHGAATFRMALADDVALLGLELFAQWLVIDRGATRGIAASRAARYELFSRGRKPGD